MTMASALPSLVKPHQLSAETPQTPNLTRRAAVSKGTTGATKVWMGRVSGAVGKASGAHHHGEAETASYVLSGRVRVYYGEDFAEYVDAGPGDFIYIPPFVQHIERNLSETETFEYVTARVPDNIVVNLDVEIDWDKHSAVEADGKGLVRVVRAADLGRQTAQTSNLPRLSGVSPETTGSKMIWMGRVTGAVGKDSGAHHHGDAETGGYVLSGATHILFGDNYENVAEMCPGDFIHVPPYVPHIERNPSQTEPVVFITVRNPENIVENLN